MELSPRQKQVAILISEGLTNPEIAARLGINVSTVDGHRRQVYARFGVRNAVELTHRTIAMGWVRVQGMRGRPRKVIDAIGAVEDDEGREP